MTRGLTKEQELVIEQRRLNVAGQILGGLGYRELARQLNVSIGTIANDVKMILSRLQKEQDADLGLYVALEIHRIDFAMNAIWDKVRTGNFGAIDRMVMLQNQRAKYQRTQVPPQIELSGPDGGPVKIEDVEKIRRKRWSEIANLAVILQFDTDVDPPIKPTPKSKQRKAKSPRGR